MKKIMILCSLFVSCSLQVLSSDSDLIFGAVTFITTVMWLNSTASEKYFNVNDQECKNIYDQDKDRLSEDRKDLKSKCKQETLVVQPAVHKIEKCRYEELESKLKLTCKKLAFPDHRSASPDKDKEDYVMVDDKDFANNKSSIV